MKKRTYRIMSVLIIIIMSVTLFAACGKAAETPAAATTVATESSTAATVEKSEEPAAEASSEAAPDTQEFVTLQIIYPGDMSNRMDEFLKNEFADKMKTDLNLGIELSWIPWDQYWGKKDVMIAAGEQIDWYWDGGPGFSQVYAKKATTDITELLNKEGQDILKMLPKANFGPFTVNGQIHAIPIQAAPTAEKFRSLLVRQDLMDEVGMSNIASVTDLEKCFELVSAKHPEVKLCSSIPNISREFFGYGFTQYGAESMILFNEETKKASAYYLSEEFQLMSKKIAEWNKKGWISEDLTIKYRDGLGRFATGLYLVENGAISRPMENINDLRKNVATATLNEYVLAPEKPKYKWLSSTEIIVISPTAKYPDRAMQMINWFLESKENYMFAIYGVDGKDYTIENGRINQLTLDSLWYEWMFRNKDYIQFPTSVTDEFINTYKTWDDNAVLSATFGFNFDASAVADQEAQLKTINEEQLVPLITGYVDFDKNYPKAVEALKKAGIEAYVAEFQRQLDAYLASK